MSSTTTPAQPPFKQAPQLTARLIDIAEEIVREYQPRTDEDGTSTAAGQSIDLTLDIKNALETIIDDIKNKREIEPGPIIAKLLSGIKLADKAIPHLYGPQFVADSITLALGSGNDGSTTGTGTRQTWANQLANQFAQPLTIARPTTLFDAGGDSGSSIQQVLADALSAGVSARAAGSGHSYSDIASTSDSFVDTHGLNRIANPDNPIAGQLSQDMLQSPLQLALGPIEWGSYDPENHHALVEMENGITIHDLNPQLESWNLGLMNMGGYDGQTMVGAISTSTHGSGIGIGPFSDMVRSVVLATTGAWTQTPVVGGPDAPPKDGVYYYRIEPSNGITNPAAYTDDTIALIQDDDCFKAVICSMGCFGIIYSVVVEVMQMYYLTETRYLTSLDQVMSDLAPNNNNTDDMPDVLQDNRHYEVLIHPYPMYLTPILLKLINDLEGNDAATPELEEAASKDGGTEETAVTEVEAAAEEAVSGETAAREEAASAEEAALVPAASKEAVPEGAASGEAEAADAGDGIIKKLLTGVVPMVPGLPAKTYYRYFLCLVTKRNIVPEPAEPKKRVTMPSFLAILLNVLLTKEPWLIPDAVTISLLTQLDKDWEGKWYEVLNLGLAGDFGFAAEIGFSAESGGNYTQTNFKHAIDRIHSIGQTSRVKGEQYQTSAFSLRFVQASEALLSMMQGRNTAMIEMDMLTGTYAGREVMYRYESNMYAYGGRPHWGLGFDFLSGNNNLLQTLYPDGLQSWMSVYNQFNALGTFNNAFTQRMGFTVLHT